MKKGKEVPKFVGAVRALVLQEKTPKSVCQLAAGYHQSIQSDTTPVDIADPMAAFAKVAKVRKARGKKIILPDEVLWVMLNSQGLCKADDEDIAGVDVTTAANITKKQACVNPPFFSQSFF